LPCGARYNPRLLEVTLQDYTIAQVLGMTVDEACKASGRRGAGVWLLTVLRDIGLGICVRPAGD
jgi:excinuclease UvrABC ATPase subunit